MERKRIYLVTRDQKMPGKHFNKILPLLFIILFAFISSPKVSAVPHCHGKPQAIGGFIIDTVCKIVKVKVYSATSIITNNICPGTLFTIDWGDGSKVDSFTVTLALPDLPPDTFVHYYPTQSVGGFKDSCLYLPVLRVTNIGYGTDQLTGIVNAWDTEKKTKAVAEIYQICQNTSGTFTFHDGSVFNCLTPRFPGLPNDTMRTEIWEYGIAGTTMPTAGMTINLDTVAFAYNDSIGKYRTATSGHAGKPIFVPVTSTGVVGNRFYVRLNIWNYCNPYPAQPPVQATSYIEVIATLPPVGVTPQVYCQNDVLAPLVATGVGPVFHWWSDSLKTKLLGAGANYLPKLPTNLSLGPDSFYYVSQQAGVGGCESKPVLDSVHIYPTLNPGLLHSPQGICYNTAPTVLDSTGATGGNGIYSYQWWSSLDNITYTNTGVTTASFTPGALTATTYYERKVSSGPCNAVTVPVKITVTPKLNPGAVQSSQNVCFGSASVTFTQKTAPSGGNGAGTYSFQWYQTTDSTTLPIKDTLIAGATSSTYLPPVQMFTRYFTRSVTSGYCQSSSSFVAVVLTPTLNPGVVAGSQNLCKNDAVANLTNTTGASGGNGAGTYTYQWQSANALNGPYAAAVPAGTLVNYPTPTPATNSIYYRRMVSSGACTSYSDSLSIIVTPTLNSGSIAASQNICQGQAVAAFTSTSAASGGNGAGTYSYQWQSSTTAVGGPYADLVGDIGLTYNPPSPGVTTYYRRAVSSGFCTSYSAAVTITVTPTLIPGVVAGSQNLCQSQAVANLTNISSASGGNGAGTYTYEWQSANALNGTYTAAVPAGTAVSYPTPTPATTSIYYRRKVISGFCTAYSDSLSIIVTPSLTAPLIAASQNICQGTPAPFTSNSPTGGFGGYTYQWYSSLNNIAFSPIGGATSQTYSEGPLGVTTYYKDSVVSQFCRVASNTLTVNVTPTLLPGTIAGNANLCQGQTPAGFTVSVAESGGNGAGTYTYQWQSSTTTGGPYTNISGATSATYSAPAPVVTTYYVRKVSSGSCTVIGNELKVTVTPTLSPGAVGSNQTLCSPGNPAGFTEVSAASGGNGAGTYSYQWQDSVSTVPFVSIGGANGTTYISPGGLVANTFYTRVVSSGFCTVRTNIINVIVQPTTTAGSVTEAAPTTICAVVGTPGAMTELTAASGGTGIFAYQWLSGTTSGGPYPIVISGATAQNYSPPAGLTVTTYFVRQVTSGVCPSVNSNQLTVTVQPTLTAGVVGSNQALCGATVPAPLTELASANGGTGAYGYQWKSASFSNGPWTNIPGATAVGYSPPGLVSTTFYKRAVSSGVCPTDTTNRVDIIITGSAPGAAGAITGPTAVCDGDQQTYSITPVAGAATYSWTIPSGAAIIGSTIANSVVINFGGASSGNVTVTPLNGCGPGPSSTVSVTVNPVPVVTAVADISACPAVDFIAVHYTSSVGGSTFNWTNSNTVIGLPASGSGDISSYIAPTNNSGSVITGNISVTATASACVSNPVTFKINIKPTPVITPQGNLTICPADIVAPSAFTSNTTGETYAWTNTNILIGLAASGTGSITAYAAPGNSTASNIVGSISVLATLNSCVSNPMNFNITVKPKPVVTVPANIVVCPGDSIKPGIFSSTVAGATFSWTNNNTSIGLVASGSGNIASYVAPANNTSVNIIGTITLTATANSCISLPITFTITIKPTPVITAIGDISVCPTNTINPGNFVANTGGGTAFSWTNNNTLNGLAASGSGMISSYAAPENLSAGSFDGLITVLGTINSCVSSPMTFHIIVKSRPILTAETDIRKCPAEIIAPANFASTMVGTTFAWTNTNTSNGLGASGSGNITSYFAPANITGGVQSGTITVTGTNTSCVSDPISFLIQVKPTPVVSAESNIAVCPGVLIAPAAFASNVSPNDTFSWTNTNIAIGIAGSGTGNIASYAAPVNTSGGDFLGTIVVTSRLENCQSSPINFTITVHPTPVFTSVQSNITVCPGSAISPNSFVTNVVGSTFTWSNDNGAIGLGLSGSGNIASYAAPANISGAAFVGNISVTAAKNSCNSAPFNFIITVNPKPVVTAQTNISVCPGQSVSPAVFTANTGGGETFSWTNTNTAVGLAASGSGNISSYVAPVNNSGSVITSTVSVTATINGCTSAPMTFTITIKPTPVINALANIAVCPGSNVAPNSFSSNTTGESYAWTNSNTAIGLVASGAGNISSYVAPVNLTGSAFVGNISVTATLNSCVSNPMNFSITINPTPVVSAISNITVCPTDAINPGAFSSNVTGAIFNWTNNNTAIGLAASGTGDIASYAAPANITSFNISGTVTVTATANGCTSTPVSFIVTIKPTPVITTQSDISVCPTASISPASFTANTGVLTAFAWTNNNTQNGLAASGNGDIVSYAAPENLSGASFDGLITVLGTLNSCVSAPMTFHIVVKSRPTLVGQADIAKCPTQLIAPAAFSNNMIGTTYSWTNSNAAIGLVISGSGNINSYTAPTNVSGSIQTGLITVTGTNNSCISDPITFQIQVKPTPVITSQSSISVCPGASIAPPNFTSNTTGETYAWTNSNTQDGLVASGAGNIAAYPAPVNVSGADYLGSISVIATLQSCASAPMSFNIDVKPTPVITPQTNISVCPGTGVSPASFISNVPASNFNWANDSISIGLGLSGVGNIIPYAAPSNLTGTAFNGNINVLATANGCVSDTMHFKITIKPQPVVTSQTDITVCAGQNITPNSFTANTGGGESFSWTNSNIAIGLGASGSGDISYVAPPNNTGSVISATISVTGQKNGCSSTPMTFIINLKPTPVITTQADIVVCKGETIGATFHSNTVGETYMWTNSNAAIGLPSPGPVAGNIIPYAAPDNLTGANVTGNISVTATLNSCVSLPMAFHITIKPTPVITHNANISTCPGSLISPASFSTAPAGSSFTWFNNNIIIGLPSNGISDISAYTAPSNLTGSDITGKIIVSAVLTSCQAVPDTFYITVQAQPVVTQLADIAVCPLSSINPPAFTSNASATSYSWTNSNTLIGLAASGSGNISSYAAPANATLSDYKGIITVTGTRNGCISSSMIFNISVHPTPQTSPILGALQECILQSDLYTVSFHANSNYVWTVPGTVTVLSGGGTANGGNADDNFVQIQFNASGNQTISVKEKSTITGCQGSPQSLTILVNPKPVISAFTGKTDVCLNDIGIAYSVQMNAGSTYQWTVPTGATISGDPTLNNIAVNYAASGGYITVKEISVAGCIGDPDSVLITIHPIPQATPSLATQTICNNSETSFNITTPTIPTGSIQFDYNIVTSSGLTAYPSSRTNLLNGVLVNDSMANTSNSQKVGIYYITPRSPYCSGPATNVTIAVQPTPKVTPSASTKNICNDQTPNIVMNTPTLPSTSVTFDYTVSVTGGVTGANPATGLTTGSQIIDVLHNPTNSVQQVTYKVVPKAFGCIGDTVIIKVFVAPTPIANSTPISQLICDGGTTSLTLTTPTLPVDSVTFSFTAISTGGISGITPSANGLKNNAVIHDNLSNGTDFQQTVTYTITPKSLGCTGIPLNDTVTVNPQPKVSITPSTQQICSGTATNVSLTTPTNPSTNVKFSYTVVATGGVTGFTTPVNNLSNNSKILDVLVNNTTALQTVTYSITPTSGVCVGTMQTAVITVNPVPQVTATPPNQSICNDKNTNITLTTPVVPSTSVTFNYTASTSGGVTGFTPSVTGLTNGSIIFDYLHNPANNAATVTYVITPYIGACVGNPISVVVNINPKPTLLSSVPNQAICNNTRTNFNLTTTTVPPDSVRFKYYVTSTGSVTGYNTGIVLGLINNAVINDSLINSSNSPQTVSYVIRPYSVGGLGCVGDSTVVPITIYPTPIVNPSVSIQTICSNSLTNINLQTPTNPTGSVSFGYTVTSSGGVSGYSLLPVNGLTNNTTISDKLVNSTNSPQTVTYTFTPTANGCTGLPKVVTVTVNPTALVTAIATQTICNNTNTNIALGTPTTPAAKVKFTYAAAATGGVTGYTASDTGLSVGYTIIQNLSNPTQFPQNVTYHVTPIFAYSCAGTPFDIVVTVNPTPDISPLVASAAICNKTSTNISLTTQSNPPSAITFNYSATSTGGTTGFSSGNALTNNSSITDILNNPTSAVQTVSYTITPFMGACVGPIKIVTISVKPTPVVVSTPAGQTICDGTSDNFKLTTSTLPVDSVRFDYTALSTGGVTGFLTSSTDLLNNAIIADVLHNPSNTPQTATYTITPRIFGCYGNSINVNINVNPTPIVTPSTLSQTVCSATKTDISLLTPTFPTASVTFNYTVVATGGTTGFTTPVIGLANNSKIKDALINPTNSPQTVTYSIVPNASGCIGSSVNVVVTVNPTPVASPSVLNQTICDGFNTNIVLGSPTLPSAGVTFDYNVVATGSVFGFVTPITGLPINSVISDTLLNFTNASQNITYQVTPKAAGCSGTTVNVTVRLNPTPVISSPAPNKETCSSTLTSLSLGTVNTPKDSVYFSYTAVLPGGLTGSVPHSGLRVGTSGYTISENLVNSSITKLAAVYTLTPNMFGCIGSPITLIDSVQPVPNVASSTLRQEICDKASTNFTLTTTIIPPSSISFSYNATATGSITGFASKNSGLSNNDIIADALYNLGNKPDSVTYKITPSTSLCSGNQITVVVVIDPTPKFNISPLNSTICSGSNTNLSITSPTSPSSGLRFDYTVTSTGGISGFTTPTNNLLNNSVIANTLVNDSLLAEKLTYLITPRSLAGCIGDQLSASVTVNPFPTIDAGVDDTICSDGTPFLTAIAGGSYTSVSWYGGAGSFSNPTSLSTIYFPNVATESGKTITLHIKTIDASGICGSVSDSVRLIIHKKPTVTASSVLSICEKVNIPVSAVANGDYNKVKWSVVSSSVPPGGTFLNPNVLTTTYIPVNGETGITTLKITLSDSLGKCQDVSSTVSVTINPLPKLDVQNSSINNQVCLGDPITFTATNALNYQFFVNGISKQASSLISKFTYVPVNSDKVWVYGTSAQGCSNYSDTTTLKVNPLPVVHLISSDANNIICKSDLVTFTANGAANYKFYVGLPPEVQALSSDQTYLTNGLAVGSNAVYALGVDSNLCKSFSDTIVTIVRDLPTAIIVSKDTAYCNNPGVKLPVKIKLTGVGPWTISWTDDAGTTLHVVDSITTSNYTFYVHPNAVSTTYRLWTVREHNGADCDGTVKPASMTVTLWELPTAQIDTFGVPATLSAGKAQLLTTTVFGGSGIYQSYQWTGDSSLLDNTDASFANFTADVNGLYHLYFKTTDNRGCIGRDSIALNVVISQIVIKLSWDSVEVCAGIPLALNGIISGDISGGTGSYISYLWKGDTSLLSKSSIRRPLFTSNVPGRYKYTFEVTDNIGTIGRDSVTVIVLQNPIINLTAKLSTAVSDTFYTCASDTVLISGNPTGGTGIYSHKWTNQINDFISADTVAVPQFHSLAQSKYQITYIVTDNKGCKSSKNFVVANEAPIAYFVFHANGTCPPVTANYQITPVNTVKYSWDFNDSSSIVNTSELTISRTFINNTLGYKNFRVTLTGFSLHGCQAKLLNPLTVYPKPATNFSAIPDSICANSRVEFQAIPGAPIYKWNFGKGELLGSSVNESAFTNSGVLDTVYKVKLVVISNDNCSDTIVKTVLVRPVPIADFDVNPFKIQYPDTVFNIVNNSPIEQYKYDWTYIEADDGLSSTETTINPGQHAFHDWGTKTIRLRAYSDYCQDTMRRDMVIDPPLPIAKFTSDSVHGCLPLTITFTNHSKYYNNVEWYFGDGGRSNEVSPTYTYDFPGDYKVTLIAKGDGGRDTLGNYDITVFDLVKVAFSLAPRVVIVPTTVVNFQNLTENGSRYLWEFGDQDTSTQFEPKHQYQQEGIYDVKLSAWSKDGCTDNYTMSEAVTAKADVKFITPNAFMPSPNGEPNSTMSDGELRYNDYLFRPAMLGVVADGYTMQIFNRWGEILFETHDINEGWTGYYRHRLCPQDVYVWKVLYKSSTGQRFEKEGTVTLYR
jgi:hypothetical protein